jgi:Trk K+ transport system NAD-binding subunit
MRVIVVGLGEAGQNIGRTLSAERHEVKVVDSDPSASSCCRASSTRS